MGYLGVSFFFALSGFTLVKSNAKKQCSCDVFLKERFFRLLVPYFIVSCVYFVFYRIFNTNLDIGDFIFSFVNGRPIADNTWYIIALIVFTIIFSVVNQYKSDTTSRVLYVTYGVILCTVLWGLIGYSSNWTNSNIAFIIGIIIGASEKKVVNAVEKYFWHISLPVGILFIGLFLCKRIIGGITADYWILLINTELICAVFTVLVISVAIKFDFHNSILDFVGKNSFEIYLIHGLVYRFFLQTKIFDGNVILFAISTLTISIILGCLLHKLFTVLCYSRK